jgi:hypothetical protein
MGMIITVIEYAAVGTCMLSLGLMALTIFGVLRNLPATFSGIRRFLGWCMLLSLSLYQPLLTNLRPPVLHYAGIDLLQPPGRICASTVLSLALLSLAHLMTGWHINAFGFGLALLHGVTVGSVWDSISQPDGLVIGDRLQ